MKRTLALFGATLQQVAHADRAEQAASRQVSDSSSAHRSRAYVLGAGLVAAALAAGQAHAQVVIQSAQEQQQQQAQGRAGTIGGVLGLAAGIAAAKNQNTVIKLVGAVAGYAGGSAIGEAVAKPSDRNRTAVGQAGMRADPLGPQSQPSDARYATSMRGGRWGGEQVFLSRDVYLRYVQQSASPVPVTGTNLKPLSTTVHQGLYQLMVGSVASRAVARQALDRVELLELEAKMNPRDGEVAREYQTAQQQYNTALREYSNSFTSAWEVIRTAERNGYEISAQRGAMSVMPADMKEPVQADLRWPGVEAKVLAMQNSVDTMSGQAATLSTLNSRADSAQPATRDRYAAVSR